MLVMNLTLVICLSMILLVLGVSLSLKFSLDREKLSPFECGFTPKNTARLPFSIRFFLIAILFLVFDVELLLLFPLIPAITSSILLESIISMVLIILVLLAGLLHEIFQGSLSWAN
uniref:NADH-ubiquinone oxidoreductase chain 3 n=1 Tax=Lovenula raynerae TaxID=2487506 RepID=A0A3G4YLH2_9MAXI|nr:NADH dehydrogenase subunit 3 [Lovenula raynerae]